MASAALRHNDSAIVIGRQTRYARYQDRPNEGQFRITHIAVQHDGKWQLAGMHVSPIAAPAPGLVPACLNGHGQNAFAGTPAQGLGMVDSWGSGIITVRVCFGYLA